VSRFWSLVKYPDFKTQFFSTVTVRLNLTELWNVCLGTLVFGLLCKILLVNLTSRPLLSKKEMVSKQDCNNVNRYKDTLVVIFCQLLPLKLGIYASRFLARFRMIFGPNQTYPTIWYIFGSKMDSNDLNWPGNRKIKIEKSQKIRAFVQLVKRGLNKYLPFKDNFSLLCNKQKRKYQ